MKMTTAHYDALRTLILNTIDSGVAHTKAESRGVWLEQYKAAILKEGKAKDVDARVRWDMLWAVPFNARSPLFDELYDYLNDDHIDTALKKIIKTL